MQNYLPKKFDVIVSNPPYVLDSEKETIKPNVLNFEPHLALFVSNENPLLFYNKIIELSKSWLHKNGTLYFEINEAFGAETKKVLQPVFEEVEIIKDMFGKDRFAIAKYLK